MLRYLKVSGVLLTFINILFGRGFLCFKTKNSWRKRDLEWDQDADRTSFDDSERFEEDESVCSWMSDTESCVDNNWRGWQKLKDGLLESQDQGIGNFIC